ncbi:MAG: hypothetical protein HYX90_00700 [Chloroflexi bacterium]|nr:hypothetical protein [Chloroflexota bacterium]
MPKKKKPATEMTTEELAKRVFPKKVRDEIRRVAEESDKKNERSLRS